MNNNNKIDLSLEDEAKRNLLSLIFNLFSEIRSALPQMPLFLNLVCPQIISHKISKKEKIMMELVWGIVY